MIIVVDEVEPAKAAGWSSERLSRAITAFNDVVDTVRVVSSGGLQEALKDIDSERDIFCPLTAELELGDLLPEGDRKSTRLNSSH